MKWPWVSRYRLEFVEAQLRASEVERRRLQDMLLTDRVSTPAKIVAPVAAAREVEEVDQPQTPALPFTSFDRLERRAATAIKNGSMPQSFRAGMH